MARNLVLPTTLALMTALSGCDSEPSPAPGAAASVTVTAPPVTAAGLNEKVRTALKTLNSGTFTQQSVLDVGDGSVTTTRDGVYDLKAGAWTLRLDYASDSESFRKSTGTAPENLTERFLSRGPKGYVTVPGWSAKLRGRWLQVTGPGATAPSGAPPFGEIEANEMDFLVGFSALTPTGVVPWGKGWTLIGEVGADVAIQALGQAGDFRGQHVNLGELEGSGEVTVDVAADGTPTTLQIDGSSIMVTSTIPKDLREALRFTRASVQLRDLGDPVTITTPKGRSVIDPSEMSFSGIGAV